MVLKLKALRKAAHVSQEELAEKIGISARSIGAWERGQTTTNIEQAWNCAVALNCTPNDLLGWYDEHPEDRPASPPADPAAAELVDAYGRCTPERQGALLQSARDAALASGRLPNVVPFMPLGRSR